MTTRHKTFVFAKPSFTTYYGILTRHCRPGASIPFKEELVITLEELWQTEIPFV